MQIKSWHLQWGCFSLGPKSPPKEEYSTGNSLYRDCHLCVTARGSLAPFPGCLHRPLRIGFLDIRVSFLIWPSIPPLTPCRVEAKDEPGGAERYYYLLLNAHCGVWPFSFIGLCNRGTGGERGLSHSHAFQLLDHQKQVMCHQATWPLLVHGWQEGPEILFRGLTIQTHLFTETVSISETNSVNWIV